MAKGFSPPHLLLASSNPLKLIQNLNHLLSVQELAKLTAELDRNAKDLFRLGESHYDFAVQLTNADWRQKISRLYYGVYNVRRAVTLKYSGGYSTDSSDHSNGHLLPDLLPNRESHIKNLRDLREDRNLADYSHSSVMTDLIAAPADAEIFATQFLADCRQYLVANGLTL